MLRVGIFFGGSAREREISFAGGRTVYDNLDRTLFEAVPIFVDSSKRFIRLFWSYLYKGSIRDFYTDHTRNEVEWRAAASSIGQPLSMDALAQSIDIAFLILHGTGGEDGSIQGLLEHIGIPYTGSGIYASALGMDKALQKDWMKAHGFKTTPYGIIERAAWMNPKKRASLRQGLQAQLGDDVMIKPTTEGSSIGASRVSLTHANRFKQAVNKAFFIAEVSVATWRKKNSAERKAFIEALLDLRSGIGLPVYAQNASCIEDAEALYALLDKTAAQSEQTHVLLAGAHSEQKVLVEPYLEGDEFSCIVIEDEAGKPHALLPTGIKRSGDLYDYRAKYLAGSRRKETPLGVSERALSAIQSACEQLYQRMKLRVYARMDGFYTKKGIYLNDPNTTSGLLPSSFVFHQAAWAGLSPSDFLTYVITQSLRARSQESKRLHAYDALQKKLAGLRQIKHQSRKEKKRVGVLTGGLSSERHIAVESGRNVYEKLSASLNYHPTPLYLSVNKKGDYAVYELPLAYLYKDHADDIHEALRKGKVSSYMARFQRLMKRVVAPYQSLQTLWAPHSVSYKTLATKFDVIFIALHGRPGEDGTLQSILDKAKVAYTGSGAKTAARAIDKHETNRFLAKHGFKVPKQIKCATKNLHKTPYVKNIEQHLGYPFIVKPIDDGCSTGVGKIAKRADLNRYLSDLTKLSSFLPSTKTHSPPTHVLVEEYIGASDGTVTEITVGILAHRQANGQMRYEALVPSEVVVKKDILTLEEKFLAGQGQNLTPVRLSAIPALQKQYITHIQQHIARAAKHLNIEGYARMDAFVRQNKANTPPDVILLEVNTLPGLTPATCLFHQAAHKGLTPADLLDFILSQALQKKTP